MAAILKNGCHFVYGMNLRIYLKMFVWSYSIIVPNFKFVSQSAQFGQNFTPTTPFWDEKHNFWKNIKKRNKHLLCSSI